MTAPVDSLPVRELIQKLGGASVLAAKLGISAQAVTNWYRDGIAERHMLRLWVLAHEAGISWKPPGLKGLTLAPAEPDSAANSDDNAPQRVA